MQNLEKKIEELEKNILENKIKREKKTILNEMKKIGIEKLPYSYSSLKPFIDPETMEFHYSKHYKGYVEKLNDALSKKKYGDLELEKIIKNISQYNQTIRNNAGGAFNHALFWNMLTPNPKKLTGELYKKIIKEFSSFSNFKKKFEEVAKERFGSGWVWLIITKNNNLKIMSTPNQDNPLMNIVENGGFPILGLDLWEHAYYLKYKNKRDDYISNFWKVVNWDFVSKLYEMKTKTKLLEDTKKSRIILEQSEKPTLSPCKQEETSFFINLMKDEDIKFRYSLALKRALQNVNWLEYKKRDETENRMGGFYKDGERHILSYLGGNVKAACSIVKGLNVFLKAKGYNPIMLKNKTKLEQLNSLQRLETILTINANKLFDENSDFYKEIVRNLTKTVEKGEKVESLSIKRLSKKFGEENVISKSGFGLESDSLGLDVIVNLDGEEKSAQIKSMNTYEISDGKVIIQTPAVTQYPQDLMIFTNQRHTLVLVNKNVSTGYNTYVFPEKNLIYVLD